MAMLGKRGCRAAHDFLRILALAAVLFVLAASLPKALPAVAAHGLSLDSHEMAGFSLQRSAKEEAEPTELHYWQSANLPDEGEMQELLQEAQNGAEGWQCVTYPAQPLLSSETRYVYLTTSLPEEGYSGTGLFFKTTNQSVRLWLDGKLLYEYGSMEDGDYSYGTRWHLVPLPEGYAGKTLTVGMHSFSTVDLGRFDHLCLRDMRASVAELFFADLPFVFGLSLIFMMGAIVAIYSCTLRRNRGAYVFLLLFFLVYGIWMVSVMNARYFLFDSPRFWWFVQLTTVYGIAILAFQFLAGFLPAAQRRTMRLLSVPFVILLVASALGEVFVARGSFFTCMNFYYPLAAIFTPWASLLLWREAKRGNEYCRTALVPLLAIAPLGLFDGLWFQYHLFAWDTYITPFALLSFVVFVLSTIRMRIRDEVRSEAVQKSLENEIVEAKEKAQIDPLTRCFNRYKFNDTFPEWVKVAQNTDGHLAFMILDIDFFKRVNDDYGHDEGDHVLRSFAGVLHTSLDRRHLLVRWGGEEFVILCLHYSLKEAETFANHLREQIAQAPICNYRPIQCSIGVSRWHGVQKDTMEALLKRADDALYRAKQEGRNCVRIEQMESPSPDGERSKGAAGSLLDSEKTECTENPMAAGEHAECTESVPVH